MRKSAASPKSHPPSVKLSSARASSNGGKESHVLAICRGSARSQIPVGICAVSLSTGKAIVTQFVDTPSFTRTVNQVELHNPVAIILPEEPTSVNGTGRNSIDELEKVLDEEFTVQLIRLEKEFWQSDNGVQQVKRLIINDDQRLSIVASIADKSCASAAVAAVYEWLQTKDMTFAPESVFIRYAPSEGTMFIDTHTSRDLELVLNALTQAPHGSFMDTLDYCQTPMGKRLLRMSILQPVNETGILERRLTAIDELLGTGGVPDKLRGLRQRLKPLAGIDFDNILAQFSQGRAKMAGKRDPEQLMGLLVQLQTTVTAVEQVRDYLTGSSSPLLQSLQVRLVSEEMTGLAETIKEKIGEREPQKQAVRGLAAKGSKLFAIRDGVLELLDVARTVYKDTREDIVLMAESISETHDLECEAVYTKAGFRFRVAHEKDAPRLSSHFINQDRYKNRTLFATHELMVANNRLRASEQEIWAMSMQIVGDLEDVVNEACGPLYRSSEAIGLIDMIASLAYACSMNMTWVRPEYGDTLAVKSGYHPVLRKRLNRDCIPNDIYAATGAANFQLVQGPKLVLCPAYVRRAYRSMSGKSTYLKQVGLLVIQGLLGCRVPADYASIRPHDALLSRLSNDDCMQRSLSTFAAEMMSASVILGMATQKSLVLIDELGRGTAPQEGIGISHAIAERLIEIKASVFFATHFKDLGFTLEPLPGVVNLRLMVDARDTALPGSYGGSFRYKVSEGRTEQEDHYGIRLAQLASLPDEVLRRADEVAKQLSTLEAQGRRGIAFNAVASRRKILLQLASKLQQVAQSSRLPDDKLAELLRKHKNTAIIELRRSLPEGA